MNYKPKICQRCGKEFTPEGSSQKYCEECRIIVAKEKRKIRRHKTYIKNKEKENQQHKLWRLRNKEHIKEYNKQYHHQHYLQHYERERAKKEQWLKEHPEKANEYKKKNLSKRRRELGFYPINGYFKGSNGHHLIDGETIIYIPAELHRSIYHNHKTGQGMEEMDSMAVRWWMENQVFPKYH